MVSESRERQQLGHPGTLRTHYPSTRDENGLLTDSRGNPYPQGMNHTTEDAETSKAYPNGFEMTIYFQFDGDEFVDTVHHTSPNVSFFQNSGVYVYDAYEIQIFNTQALINVIQDHSDQHEHIYPATVDNTVVRPDGYVDTDEKIKLHHHTSNNTVKTWEPDKVNHCVTGIPYKTDTSYSDYNDLNYGASRLASGTNKLFIDCTPDPNGGDPFFDVELNDTGMFYGTTLSTGSGSQDGPDEQIHLQSHWGSGVKFTDVEIVEKPSQ